MQFEEIVKQARKLARQYCITDGKDFRLKDVDPGDTAWLKAEDKPQAQETLQAGVQALVKLQDLLYAQDRWALLVILQGMDAAGKDGVIKHVMSGVNPQGCHIVSFKVPSAEELDHDYLWRCSKALPERGRIGIFNRSYYEECLVVRVHSELLDKEKLPRELITKKLWEDRFRDIRGFERYLSNNGVVIRKFFLHVSREEQKRRFLERIDKPEKNWKFSLGDVHERRSWKDYMDAYEDAIRETATEDSPWYVVPADNKWFTRTVVAAAMIESLAALDLRYPQLDKDRLGELEEAKIVLLAEK